MDINNLSRANHPAVYYQEMLADRLRMARYREAIRRAVRPGDLVADLGTGLGILALMAVQCGARRVYAIDNRPNSLWLAQRVVTANGAADKINLIEADIREVVLPEPVDIVINELIGEFGTDENIVEYVSGFAAGNLKPGGRILPQHLTTYLVPVEYRDEFRGVFSKAYFGLDLRAAIDLPCQPNAVLHPLYALPKELAKAHVMEDVAFNLTPVARLKRIPCRFEIHCAGVLQGFVGYFKAQLWDDVWLSNYPNYPGGHWYNWHWPVDPPIEVHPGQEIEAKLNIRENMVAAGWTLDWDFD